MKSRHQLWWSCLCERALRWPRVLAQGIWPVRLSLVAEFLHHQLFPASRLPIKLGLAGLALLSLSHGVSPTEKSACRHPMGSPLIPSRFVRDLGSAPLSWCLGALAYFSGLRFLGFWGYFRLCFLCVARGPRFPSFQLFSSAKRGGRGAARPPFSGNPLRPLPMCRQLPFCLLLRALLAGRAVLRCTTSVG